MRTKLVKSVQKFSKASFVFALLGILALSSCRTDIYNKVTDKTEDVRKGDEYVYGEGPDAPARQSELEYPDPADAEKKAQSLRKKMFGEEEVKSPAPATETAPADSSQNALPVDSAATEEGKEI